MSWQVTRVYLYVDGADGSLGEHFERYLKKLFYNIWRQQLKVIAGGFFRFVEAKPNTELCCVCNGQYNQLLQKNSSSIKERVAKKIHYETF